MNNQNTGDQHEVAIVYQYLQHYREPVFSELCRQQSPKPRYTVYSDTKANAVSLNTISVELADQPVAEGGLRWRFIRNFWMGRILLWQPAAIRLALDSRYRTIIYLGSMYFISTWLSAWLARRKGKRVLMWTHGLYHDEGGFKGWLRRRFYRLSDGLLLYGNRARGILIKRGFSPDDLYVIFNSLDHKTQTAQRDTLSADTRNTLRHKYFSDPQAPVLTFIGRLTPRKQVGLLLDAIAGLANSGRCFNVLVIGDGPLRQSLEDSCCELGLRGQVRFHGSCHEEVELSKLLQMSDMCVSPGAIGLLAMHAMVYGLPVLTHDDPVDHGPEFEAIIEGETGTCFHKGDVDSLARTITAWFDTDHNHATVAAACNQIIDHYYTPEFQTRIINAAVAGKPATSLPLGEGPYVNE